MTPSRPGPRPYPRTCPHELLIQSLVSLASNEELPPQLLGVVGEGCGSKITSVVSLPFLASPRGRAMSLAEGAIQALPEVRVFTYLGVDELCSEGLTDFLRAARRGLDVVSILVESHPESPHPRGQGAGSLECRVLPHAGRLLRQDLCPLLRCAGASVEEVELSSETAASDLEATLSKVFGARGLQVVLVSGGCPAVLGGEA